MRIRSYIWISEYPLQSAKIWSLQTPNNWRWILFNWKSPPKIMIYSSFNLKHDDILPIIWFLWVFTSWFNWKSRWSILFLNYLCTFSTRSERYSINVSENADPQVFYSIKIVTLCQIVAEINWLESAPNSLKVHSYMIMFLWQFCFSSTQKWQL